MSSTLRGVVLCHGEVAGAMIDAVEHISGTGHVLVPLSNRDCDRASLRDRLLEAIDHHDSVVFVDLPTGSCLMAALRCRHEAANVRVVSGVNIPMLLDFVFHLDRTVDEAAASAVVHGVQGIGQP